MFRIGLSLLCIALLSFCLLLSSADGAAFTAPAAPTCAARSSATTLRLRGGGISSWFADGNEDLLEKEDKGTDVKAGEAATGASAEKPAAEEQPKRRRCEEITRRAECKAQEECTYDTARGCYTKESYKKEMAAKEAQSQS